jgi:LruC domain-containing protein
MNKFALTALFGILAVSACQKDASVNVAKVSTTHELVVPTGFTWENSRDIYFDINIADAKFPSSLYVVAIYDKDPALNGTLLSKGSASQSVHFKTKIYIANTVKEVFVVRVAPDNTKTTQVVPITGVRIALSMSTGDNSSSGGNKVTGIEDSPGCSTGCNQSITSSGSNIVVNNGDVYCVTGSNINVSFIVYNGTVRICGSNVTISSITLDASSSLIVTSSGSATINSLSLYTANTSFKNYGTTTFSSSLGSNGNILNEGVMTVNNDLNVQAGSNFTNNGAAYINGSMNNSTSNTVVNNGSLVVNKDLQVYSVNTFANNCSTWIKGDYFNSGTTKNYNLFKVNGTSQIYASSEHGLYNGAIFKTANITVSGTLKGYGTTSLVKVSGNSTLYSNAAVRDALQYCDANGVETNQASFTGSAALACSVYIPVSNCNSEGNGEAPVADTDKDGVIDSQDAYPNDPTKAFNSYYPSDAESTNASIAFEDQWPIKGDYDFNDVVVSYRYKIVTNAQNKVVQVVGDYTLRAAGTGYNDGFGIEFPILRSIVSDVKGGTLEDKQANAVIILFNDVKNEMPLYNTWPKDPTVKTKSYSISFNLKDGPDISTFGLSPYNPFIWNGNPGGGGRSYEIHLPGKTPTSLADQKLFGTGDDNSLKSTNYYVTKTGLPWAINIPVSTFDYPIEETDISSAYLNFQQWAESGGKEFQDWYSSEKGYRDDSKIYVPK